MPRRSSASALLVLAVVCVLAPLVSSSPVQAAGSTVTSVAVADGYVSAKSAKSKYGSAKQLRVSGSPLQRTFLRFQVTGVTGAVDTATLTLRPTRAAAVPLEVRGVTGSWSEKSLSWNRAPDLGDLVGSADGVPTGSLDIDVTAAITGDGTLDLAVVPAASATSTTVAEFSSREVAQLAPTLTVTTVATPPPPDTTAPTAPTGLTAAAGDGSVTLSWQANADPDLARYRVFRRIVGAEWPTEPMTAVTGTGYTDTAVANGTTYEYRITAVDTADNESAPSATATAQPTAPPAPPEPTTPPPPAGPCAATGSYSSDVLATGGLAAYWRLGDSTGTVACEARGTSEGQYKGGFTLERPGLLTGDANTSARFDGATGYVKVFDNPALDPSSAMTLEAWVDTGAPTASQTILRKQYQYLLRISGGSLIGRIWWSPSSYTEVDSPAVITGGAQHLAMTYDGTAIRLYRNGVEIASRPATGPVGSDTSAIYIGKSGGYDYFDGRLDEVALYRAALSQATLAAHYREGTAPAPEVLGVPQGLTAVGAPGKVGLRWSPVAGATGYRVDQRAGDGSWAAAGTTGGATAYVVGGLVDGHDYTFRVTAMADGTESTPSTTAVAAPTSSVLLAGGDIADVNLTAELTAQLLDRNPGDVLALGDNAYPHGEATSFRDYYDPTWGRHLWRTHGVVGNHDYDTAGAAPYWDYFGAAAGPGTRGYYSYDLGSWHVVVLNSTCYMVGGCDAGSPQEQWLRADLEASQARCTVVAWHHPTFSSGSGISSSGFGGVDTRMHDLWALLMSHGAELVLNGHDHAYERFVPQDAEGRPDPKGIRELIVGTGGASLHGTSTRLPNSEVRFTDTRGVLRLDLTDGGYSWRFLPVDGSTKTDSGTESCH